MPNNKRSLDDYNEGNDGGIVIFDDVEFLKNVVGVFLFGLADLDFNRLQPIHYE